MTSEQQAVPVAQEDREAAAALDDALGFLTDLERPIVEQAFARHRLASLPCKSGEGAEVAPLRKCSRCLGTGAHEDGAHPCGFCGGSGKVNSLPTPDATQTREAELLEQIAALEKRGAEAVIAYHVAICSPKGVVPDDNFYDAKMAADIQASLDAGIPLRAALNARGGA